MRIQFRVASAVLAIAMSTTTMAAADVGQAHACSIASVTFNGWKAQQVSNEWVNLTIVPQLGGRLMQVAFGGHDFLFVNPKYMGKYIPPAEAAGSWINYGGDKIWPLPEGRQDQQHWVLKSDPLDDGEYAFRVTSTGATCSALLEGPPDAVTGLQYSREIAIGSDSPAITFHAVMKNISDHDIRWSVQSVSQYDLSDHQGAAGFNRNFFAFTPANRNSAYFTSYQVRNGLADDPSFEIVDGLFRLHWLYLENEVWLDSPAGWVAVVDRATHYAMVELFSYQATAEYPGKATVILYKNGASLGLNDKMEPRLFGISPSDTPYYMEAELNSPMVSLRPGETYAFDTKWFPTRAGDALRSVTEAGVIEIPPAFSKSAKGVSITGTFGVFFPGTVQAYFLDERGTEVGRTSLGVVNPLQLLELHADVAAPQAAAKISLHLLDERGVDRGVLGEAKVQPAIGGGAA